MNTQLVPVASDQATVVGDDIAQEIGRLHIEVLSCVKVGLETAIRIGELLTQQKEKLGHGYFTRWINANLPFTDRTARNYMRLYEGRDRLKTETVSVLTEGYKLLAFPGDKTKLERPWDLYFAAKGSLLVLNKSWSDEVDRMMGEISENGETTIAPESIEDRALTHSNTLFKAMESYLAGVETTSDLHFMIREYAWGSNVFLEMANGWAEHKLRRECKAGQILNEMQNSYPALYDFLKANNFSGVACQWLVDECKKRIIELESQSATNGMGEDNGKEN